MGSALNQPHPDGSSGEDAGVHADPGSMPRAGRLFSPPSRACDLIAAYPALAMPLARLGLDGDQRLAEATPGDCEEILLARARAAPPPPPPPANDWSSAEIFELISGIVHVHHFPLRHELERLGLVISALARRHPDLVQVPLERCYLRLAERLPAHLDQEENEVFPSCLAVEAASRGHGAIGPLLISEGIRDMLSGHDETIIRIDHCLRLVDAATTLAVDPDLERIHAGLAAMGQDLQTHAAIESGVLAPAALFAEDVLHSVGRHPHRAPAPTHSPSPQSTE